MLVADGLANTRIGEVVGVSVPTVLKWRSRHLHDGLDGLIDAVRSGWPQWLGNGDQNGRCRIRGIPDVVNVRGRLVSRLLN